MAIKEQSSGTQPPSTSTSNDLRQIVTWVVGALVALSAYFARTALDDLRAAVIAATTKTEAAATTINTHSTKIELLELRVTQHDQRIEALEKAKH